MSKLIIIASHLVVAAMAAGITLTLMRSEPLAGVNREVNPDLLPSDPYLQEYTSPQTSDANGQFPAQNAPQGSEQSNTIFGQQLAAHQLAADSEAAAVEQHLQRYLEKADHFYHENIAFIFLERLIAIDVYRALAFVDRSSLSYEKRKQLYASIVTSWVRHDPEAAVEYYVSIQSIDLKQAIGGRLLMDSVFAKSEYFETVKLELGSRADIMLTQIQNRNASPVEAFDAALAATGRNQRGALSQAINRWYRQDPEAALQRVLNLNEGPSKELALNAIVRLEAREDAFAALEMLRTYFPEGSQQEAGLMSRLLTQDASRGLPIIEDFVSRTGNVQVLSQAVGSWMRTDPDAAIAYVQTLDGNDRTIVLANASMAYLSERPEQAMNWIMSLDEPHIRASAMSSLPHIAPELAESWLRDTSLDSKDSAMLLQGLASQRAQLGLDPALAWARDHEDNPGYIGAVTTILSQHSQQNPALVADYLSDYQDDNQMSQVFNQLGMAWGNKDPEAAMDWIESLPESNNRDLATNTYIMSIAQRDQDLAVDLLDSMEVRNRDQVAFQLAHHLLMTNPADKDGIIQRLGLPNELANQLRSPGEFGQGPFMSTAPLTIHSR